MEKSAGIVLLKNDKILLVHPASETKVPWSIPKGKIEADEGQKEAAIRETYEETGIVIEPHSLKFLGRSLYPNGKKQVIAYYIEVDNSVEPESELSYDIQGIQWYTLEEAKKVIHKGQLSLIESVEYILNDKKDSK